MRPNASCHGDVLIEQFQKQSILKSGDVTVLVGIFHSPEEFTQLSLQCRHPFEAIELEQQLLRSISFRTSHSVAAVTQHREETLERWRRLAASLAEDEAALHARMHPDVEKVMHSKRLLLFKHMLREIKFEKADDLIHLMVTGFPLVGALPATGVFPPKERQAKVSLEDLWRGAKKAVPGASGDHDGPSRGEAPPGLPGWQDATSPSDQWP